MKKRNKILVLIAAAAVGVSLAGCATNAATTKSTNFSKKPIEIAQGRQYEILGPVTLEKKWSGILGLHLEGTPISAPADIFLYQSGGVTYVDLLEKAQEQYPGADAVIDINVDYEGSTYAIFYAQRNNIVSGIAIKYAKAAAAPANPTLELRVR
jgi:hypothetical protein